MNMNTTNISMRVVATLIIFGLVNIFVLTPKAYAATLLSNIDQALSSHMTIRSNIQYAFKFTAGSGAEIESLVLDVNEAYDNYPSGTHQTISVRFYEDNAGLRGNQIGGSLSYTSQNNTNGYVTFATLVGDPIVLPSADDYWLGLVPTGANIEVARTASTGFTGEDGWATFLGANGAVNLIGGTYFSSANYPKITINGSADNPLPSVTTYSPGVDASSVAVDANLVLTFTEAMGADTGFIYIKNASDDSVFETIDVAGGPITGDGTDTITINPTQNLAPATTYYIEVDDTALRSIAEAEYFTGIAGSTQWRFTTAGNSTGKISATPEATTLDEGDSEAFGLLLDEPIIGDTQIQVTIVSSDTNRATVSTPSVTFSSDAWQEARNFSVTTIDDNIDNDSDTVTITLTAVTDAEYYNGYQKTINLTLVDDDEAGIYAPIPIQSLTEHPTTPIVDILRFTLESEPLENVTITPISANEQVSFDPVSITFTPANWDEQQSIVTMPIDDDIYEGEHTDTVTFAVVSDDPSYEGMLIDPVAVTIIDDEQAPLEQRRTVSSGSVGNATTREQAQKIFAEYYARQAIEASLTLPDVLAVLDSNTYQKVNNQNINTNALQNIIEKGGLLRLGDKGDAVRELQNLLNEQDVEGVLVADGIFGKLTDSAVRVFQAQRNLTIDGIVGRQTFTELK